MNTNRQRALWAAMRCYNFCESPERLPHTIVSSENTSMVSEDDIRDLMVDLLHLASVNGICVETLVADVKDNYFREAQNEMLCTAIDALRDTARHIMKSAPGGEGIESYNSLLQIATKLFGSREWDADFDEVNFMAYWNSDGVTLLSALTKEGE